MRPWLLAVAIALLAACEGSIPLDPPTPAFLEDPGSNNGVFWEAGCPSRGTALEAQSPNLVARLTRQFPPGSQARRLEEMLLANGFRVRERHCPDGPGVRLAEFNQRGGSLSGPAPTFAQIAWQQDSGGRLLWIKAFVQYRSL
jgi:hypothetical protein